MPLGPADTTADEYREQLAAVTEFADFGPLFRSSKSVSLTEAETEYSVSYVKHIFENHCVLQFTMVNTLNDQILENVKVWMCFIFVEHTLTHVQMTRICAQQCFRAHL